MTITVRGVSNKHCLLSFLSFLHILCVEIKVTNVQDIPFIALCLGSIGIDRVIKDINPYKPSVPFLGQANSADPDQTPQNTASDQGLHCLLTGISIITHSGVFNRISAV